MCPPLRLAEVEIARTSDLGQNDTRFRVLTHLGHILRAGDLVLGYDLVRSSLNCDAAEELERKKGKGGGLPDVVLVRKVYSKDDQGKARQKWRLKSECSQNRQWALSGGTEWCPDGSRLLVPAA